MLLLTNFRPFFLRSFAYPLHVVSTVPLCRTSLLILSWQCRILSWTVLWVKSFYLAQKSSSTLPNCFNFPHRCVTFCTSYCDPYIITPLYTAHQNSLFLLWPVAWQSSSKRNDKFRMLLICKIWRWKCNCRVKNACLALENVAVAKMLKDSQSWDFFWKHAFYKSHL